MVKDYSTLHSLQQLNTHHISFNHQWILTLQVGIGSSFPLCSWDLKFILLDRTSPLRECKISFSMLFGLLYKLFLQELFNTRNILIVATLCIYQPVLAVLLRHISHHSSLWSSQERRWSMPIKVSTKIWTIFYVHLHYIYLLCFYIDLLTFRGFFSFSW